MNIILILFKKNSIIYCSNFKIPWNKKLNMLRNSFYFFQLSDAIYKLHIL